MLPQWATLAPFALNRPSQFRPAGPPWLGSQAWADAFNDVKNLGASSNSTRTADQTEMARFWVDGAGTDTPPGHWNRIAASAALQAGNSLTLNARLFAQLNVALADATIVCWDAKYHYGFWRPVTAIRAADTDGRSDTFVQANWTPLLVTPPFPEYISGHSTFSGAAAETLTGVFGAAYPFTADSPGLPGVQRSYASFNAAAEEAGRSRIYGGLHFEFSNQGGLAAGRTLAGYVRQGFDVTTDTQAPRIVLADTPAGLATNANFVLHGHVLDNLSGVARLETRLDSGVFNGVAFGADGQFAFLTSLALNGTGDGAHVLQFAATDAADNASEPYAFAFSLDTRPPQLTVTAPLNGSALGGGARIHGMADGTGAGLARLTYAFDSGDPRTLAFDTSGAFDQALDLALLGPGAHALAVSAHDAAGNAATTNLTVNLPQPIPFRIADYTPVTDAADVGTAQKPKVVFSRPVNPATLTTNNFYATDSSVRETAGGDCAFRRRTLCVALPGAVHARGCHHPCDRERGHHRSLQQRRLGCGWKRHAGWGFGFPFQYGFTRECA